MADPVLVKCAADLTAKVRAHALAPGKYGASPADIALFASAVGPWVLSLEDGAIAVIGGPISSAAHSQAIEAFIHEYVSNNTLDFLAGLITGLKTAAAGP